MLVSYIPGSPAVRFLADCLYGTPPYRRMQLLEDAMAAADDVAASGAVSWYGYECARSRSATVAQAGEERTAADNGGGYAEQGGFQQDQGQLDDDGRAAKRRRVAAPGERKLQGGAAWCPAGSMETQKDSRGESVVEHASGGGGGGTGVRAVPWAVLLAHLSEEEEVAWGQGAGQGAGEGGSRGPGAGGGGGSGASAAAAAAATAAAVALGGKPPRVLGALEFAEMVLAMGGCWGVATWDVCKGRKRTCLEYVAYAMPALARLLGMCCRATQCWASQKTTQGAGMRIADLVGVGTKAPGSMYCTAGLLSWGPLPATPSGPAPFPPQATGLIPPPQHGWSPRCCAPWALAPGRRRRRSGPCPPCSLPECEAM